ncbi:protocatechuate 4,5-dioxygenase subunit alpha [Rugamonas apoptosis]|uniref:Protocatechuate 4,5-dioxygenase subunit alpha n=1 Tax=Rugamonas apoptosis TaxID=2758570 RepID=A0A7W2FCF0_9BURK|nr:protocatechuate 4,5-dioxygenase subunit alpha [Rugamonas apoptosis]MBA5689123.1 protocatechuate 4,5-dioxygenase subunit alpha [Rugamonas apoptosis]
MTASQQKRTIPGAPIFDSDAARHGYALNKMCYSFNSKVNRDAFVSDERAYCQKFGLNQEQTRAILERDVLSLIRAGGGVYFLGKLAGGVLGLDMQDIGALQTGLTKEEFKAKLVAAGK